MRNNRKKFYKHSIEAGVHMYLGPYQTLQQTEIDYFSEVSGNIPSYHIYFILKRPKVCYDKETTIIHDEYIELGYKVLDKDKMVSRTVIMNNYFKSKKGVSIESAYPYNYIKIKQNKTPIIEAKLAVIIDECHRVSREKDHLLDFEVLYIGQAFGKNGKRTALNRLSKHETLQNIYSHAMNYYPSSDIWLMLTSFEQLTSVFIGGTVPTKEINHDEDYKRFSRFHGGIKFSEQQRINFTEAALIRLFRPLYNIQYKDSFPNFAHTTYRECYEIDINAISVELDTSDMRRRLYTKYAKPKYNHKKTFYLNDVEDRIKMFDFDWRDT